MEADDMSDLFDRAGRALYGDHYVAPMGDLLDVDKNSIAKWRNGKAPVPGGVWRTVVTEVEERERALGLLRNELIDVATRRVDGRVDSIGPHFPPNAAGMFVADCKGLPAVVVAHNVKNLTMQLSREVRPADLDAFRNSFEGFTDGLGLQRGVVAAKGCYMKALLRDALSGGQPRALREWFNGEIDRIDHGG
jgi:hypothetical protein